MKRRLFQRIAAALVLTLAVVGSARAADDSSSRLEPQSAANELTPILVATCPDMLGVWDAVERVAQEMKFGAVAQAIRIMIEAEWGDASREVGLVLATKGGAFVPFGYLRVESLDEYLDAISPRVRAQIETTDDGTFFQTAKTTLQLLEKDGWLFVFYPDQKELVPTTEPTVWRAADAPDDAFLTVDVDVAAIPPELVQAVLGAATRRIATTQEFFAGLDALDADALKSLESGLRYSSELVAALDRFVLSLKVDPESADFVAEYSFAFKNGSAFQESLDLAKSGETRWGAVLETPNAIVANANGGKTPRRDADLLADYYRTNVFGLVLNGLEKKIDDDAAEKTREFVEALQNAALAELESGSLDFAFALCGGEKPLVVSATKLTNADEARRALRTFVDSLRESADDAAAFDEICKLDAQTVDGFSVSTVDFPIPEDDVEDVPYFAGKAATVRAGIADDAALFVFALDAAQADAEFSRIAAGYASGKTVANPKKSSLTFAPFAEFVVAFAKKYPDAPDDSVFKIFERFAEANDARLDVSYRIDGARLDVEYVLTGEFFAAVGDAIRAQITGGGSVDDSEELDDIFDDEELDFDETKKIDAE